MRGEEAESVQVTPSGVWSLTEVVYMMDGDEEREKVAHKSGRTWTTQLLIERPAKGVTASVGAGGGER